MLRPFFPGIAHLERYPARLGVVGGAVMTVTPPPDGPMPTAFKPSGAQRLPAQADATPAANVGR